MNKIYFYSLHVFHCVHKEIDNAFSLGDNYSFRESGLQITLHLLSSSLGNTVLLHTIFLEYETQIGQKKKLDNVFQSNCSSHAEFLTNLRKIEKRPKIRHKAVMHPALQISGFEQLHPDLAWSIHSQGFSRTGRNVVNVWKLQKTHYNRNN